MHRRVKLAVNLAAIVSLVAATAALTTSPIRVVVPQLSVVAYAPQPERTAGWIGPVDQDYTAAHTSLAIADAYYEIVDAFRRTEPITSLFPKVRRLAAASAAGRRGPSVRILEYYEPTVWFATNPRALAPYARQFRSQWLLRDAGGNLVPYYGVGRSAARGNRPIGYLIDLADADYRRWVVGLLANWMHMAPFRGVIFDSAQPLIGEQRRAIVGDGRSFADIFCGTAAARASGCVRLDRWNSGLQDLIGQTSAALHALGDEVAYNGIAPGPVRGPSRNLGMLAHADIATNESFCYSVESAGRADFTPAAQDLEIMQRIAAESKKVVEITNYQSDRKRSYGSYCLAEFLLGWQPGSSYFLYQRSYSDGIDRAYPEIAEHDLNLGDPTTRGYTAHGAVLSRRFDRGFVAVNTGTAPATVRVTRDSVAFSGGTAQRMIKAGALVTLGPKDALFLLDARCIQKTL